MSWPTPKTWVVGDTWPVADANSYIRDALTSVRRYQNSLRWIYDGGGTVSGTLSTLGSTHHNLLSSSADEGFNIIVLCNLQCHSTSDTFVQVEVHDQGGTDITPGGTRGFNVGPTALMGDVLTDIYGSGYYAGGGQNGFSLKAKDNGNTGNVTLSYHAIVLFSPAV